MRNKYEKREGVQMRNIFGKIKAWLIFRLVGDQPVVMNVPWSIPAGVHQVSKPILIKNIKEH